VWDGRGLDSLMHMGVSFDVWVSRDIGDVSLWVWRRYTAASFFCKLELMGPVDFLIASPRRSSNFCEGFELLTGLWRWCGIPALFSCRSCRTAPEAAVLVGGRHAVELGGTLRRTDGEHFVLFFPPIFFLLLVFSCGACALFVVVKHAHTNGIYNHQENKVRA
jgi:hypothetical protein